MKLKINFVVFVSCFFTGLTVSTLAHSLTPNSCESLFETHVFREETRDGYLMVDVGVNSSNGTLRFRAAAEGSVSARLNYSFLGKVEKVERYGFPGAFELNKIFNLTDSSPVRAKATLKESLFDDYRRNLGRGDLEIAKDDPHDALDHFVGYWLFSHHPAWEVAKGFFNRYYSFKDNPGWRRTKASIEAEETSHRLAFELELVTDQISKLDRLGRLRESAGLVQILGERVKLITSSSSPVFDVLEREIPTANSQQHPER